MKNIKILLSLLLVLCIALGAAACGSDTQPDSTPVQESEVESDSVSLPESEVEEESQPADDGKVDYTVTVVDETGAPIPGALVQLCQDTCYPSRADDQGVAHFSVPEADYKVSFLSLPEGYTYSTDAQEFYFEAGSNDMTIVLNTADK